MLKFLFGKSSHQVVPVWTPLALIVMQKYQRNGPTFYGKLNTMIYELLEIIVIRFQTK